MFEFEAALEPALGGCAPVALLGGMILRGKFEQTVEFILVEVEQQLARHSLHGPSLNLYPNLFPVGIELELREWVLDMTQFVAERDERTPDLPRRYMVLAKLDQRSQAEQLAEAIGDGGRHQLLALPALQLPLGDPQNAPRLSPRKGLLRGGA
jgi:hypothetical protein